MLCVAMGKGASSRRLWATSWRRFDGSNNRPQRIASGAFGAHTCMENTQKNSCGNCFGRLFSCLPPRHLMQMRRVDFGEAMTRRWRTAMKRGVLSVDLPSYGASSFGSWSRDQLTTNLHHRHDTNNRNPEKQTAELLFEDVQAHRDSMSEQEMVYALVMNVNQHVQPVRGLENAIEIAKWMTAKGCRIPKRTWNTILVQMIEMNYPMEQLIVWLDTYQGSRRSKDLSYVFDIALRQLRMPEVVLPLLTHLLRSGHDHDTRKDRITLLRVLVDKFLAAQPTVQQLEEFVALVRLRRVVLSWSDCRKIASYYLDPSHHAAGRSHGEITESFLLFLRTNWMILKWHSRMDLFRPEKVGDDIPERRRAALVRVVQESLALLEETDREAYLLGVFNPERDCELLYGMARIRSSSEVVPMDYDLYSEAVIANAHRHEDPRIGLARSIEVSEWMAAKGFKLPKKSWDSVLLKMIQLDCPLEQMSTWVDTQPVDDLIKSMIYVLSIALENLRKPEVALFLIKHSLDRTDVEEASQVRRGLLVDILDKFLAAHPTIRQLEEYVGYLQSKQTAISRGQCDDILSYYLHQLHNEDDQPSSAFVASFLAFLQSHADVLRWHSSLDLSAPELVGSGNISEMEGAPLAIVVEESLMMVDVNDQELYLFAVCGGERDPVVLYDLAEKRSKGNASLMDYDLYENAILSSVYRHESARVGLSNAMQISAWMAAKGFRLSKKTWSSVLLQMMQLDCPLKQITGWIDTQPVDVLTESMVYVLSNALDKLRKPDLTLTLIQHYLDHAGAYARTEDRSALLGCLLHKLLAVGPTITQLEEYLSLMNSNRTLVDRKTFEKIKAYYSDPSHQEPGRSLDDVTACLSLLVRARESAQSLFENARRHHDSMTEADLAYAVQVNVHHHKNPSRGLRNAVTIAKWMAKKGYRIPKKTWDSVLLKMVELEYPLESMTGWMDAQPVDRLTNSMIYVLSNALDRLCKPEAVVSLVKHYLKHPGCKGAADDRKALLGFLLNSYLAANPTVEQLGEYISLMQSNGMTVDKKNHKSIVAYFTDPSHHETGRSKDDKAAGLAALMRANQRFFASAPKRS